MVERSNNDTRYAVDIRVFVTVIVVAMAVSFGIGVGLGPSGGRAEVMTVPAATPLPPVTSVQVAESGDFPPDDDLHEPAGQVRCVVLCPFWNEQFAMRWQLHPCFHVNTWTDSLLSFVLIASVGGHQRH